MIQLRRIRPHPMPMPFSRRRRILCSANNGVNVVMYRPILDRLGGDDRLRIRHTATLSHTRRIDPSHREDVREFFRAHGIEEGIVHFRVARYMPFDLYLSPNFSSRIMPRHAKVKVQIFHGVSFKNCAIAPKSLVFDRLFLPGPYHRRRFVQLGLMAEDDPRMVMVGLPKLDRLVDGTLRRDEEIRRLGLDPALPTVLYAPTGDVGNSLHRQGEALIEALLSLPINVVVKPHDHAERDPRCTIDWKAKLRDWKHERLRCDLGSDVVPLLAAADLLVTDASSVAFEYALRDRPIVFVDVPEILSGPRAATMDLDTWGRKAGDVVRDARELRATVERLLDSPGEKSEIRRALARDLFHEPGTAAARAARLVYDLIDLEPPAALRDVPIPAALAS